MRKTGTKFRQLCQITKDSFKNIFKIWGSNTSECLDTMRICRQKWVANRHSNYEWNRCSKLVYKDLGKEIYQIEAPKEFRAPKEWARLSATGVSSTSWSLNAVVQRNSPYHQQKFSRYWTPTIRKLVGEYKEALETKNSIVKSFTSRVYAKFDEHYFTWLSAVKHTAELDCLLSLAISSMSLGGEDNDALIWRSEGNWWLTW